MKRTRLISVLLSAMLLLGTLAAPVFAQETQAAVTSDIITEVKLTGIDPPVHRASGDTTLSTNDYRVSVGEVEWHNQDGTKMTGGFEYGRQYVLNFYLFVGNNRDFAKDYTHPLAAADKPMPAVNVTVDGIKATVLPDYGRNIFMRALKVAVVYTCEEKVTLNDVSLVLTEPKAGGYLDYEAGYNTSGYTTAALNDEYNKNGIAWRVDGGAWLTTDTKSFENNETYQVQVRLAAENGYEFAVDESGNSLLNAKINGRTAEVKANRNEAILTYTFPKTGNLIRSAAAVHGIDKPKEGATPDYEAIWSDDSTVPADYHNATTKNGITWYCETDKRAMTTNEKFEADKVYTVQITLWAADNYEFAYTNGEADVRGVVNGEDAQVTSRDPQEVTLYYTFPKVKEIKTVETISITGVDLNPASAYAPLPANVKVTPSGVKIADFNWDTLGKTWRPGIADVTVKAEEGYLLTHETVLRVNGYYASLVTTDGESALYRCIFDDVFKTSPEKHKHKYSWAATPFEHWQECACGETADYDSHTFDGTHRCTVCGYKVYDIASLPFVDVKADDYFAQAVGWAFENGVTTGTSATEFSPEMTCSRGQVVTFLWRAAGCPEPKTSKNPFVDVPDGIWYHKAVLWAVEQGITKGTSETEFSPDMTCSTAVILTFLFRAVGAGTDGWYQEAAEWAEYNDMLMGINLPVDPQTPCPRSAVVTFLYRFYE